MTETIHGTITLPDKIDITDPCYDKDVWCRINNFPITAGEYECYTLVAEDYETCGWGKRVARIGIRMDESDDYERKGIIGVDAGMAGFFNCDNRKVFEEYYNYTAHDVFKTDNAFWSSSGYGDGTYEVYAGYKNGKIVEVYIEFIGDNE